MACNNSDLKQAELKCIQNTDRKASVGEAPRCLEMALNFSHSHLSLLGSRSDRLAKTSLNIQP